MKGFDRLMGSMDREGPLDRPRRKKKDRKEKKEGGPPRDPPPRREGSEERDQDRGRDRRPAARAPLTLARMYLRSQPRARAGGSDPRVGRASSSNIITERA